MNGARALLSTLAGAGVDVCFANPGTSELHLVAALDDVPAVRGVLCLFEGVATGAADGYGRVTGHPAATLLHLGPGLANGLANLHNARRAHTPVVNLVGEHATGHGRYDPPLNSDIASLARPVSGWYRATLRAEDLAADAADAVAAALGPPGCVATLVVPADASWSGTDLAPCPPRPGVRSPRVPAATIEEVAASVRAGPSTALLLGGSSLRARGLDAAARVAARTGAAMLAETFPSNLERGAGVAPVERLPYLGEMVLARLAGIETLVLVDAAAPVSYFGYADRPSDLVPVGCRVQVLARPGEDAPGALEELAAEVGAPARALEGTRTSVARPERPVGPLTSESLAAALGATLPEQAVVVDEGNTAGLFVAGATAGAPRHDWLTLTGGAIGMGPPMATGAAVGARGKRIVSLQADGSAMYTFQALWTQAREGLDVTTVVLSNASYGILHVELRRIGVGAGGPAARRLLDLTGPGLDFCALARGMGVPARRVERAEELVAALESSFAEPGPALIEVPL